MILVLSCKRNRPLQLNATRRIQWVAHRLLRTNYGAISLMHQQSSSLILDGLSCVARSVKATPSHKQGFLSKEFVGFRAISHRAMPASTLCQPAPKQWQSSAPLGKPLTKRSLVLVPGRAMFLLSTRYCYTARDPEAPIGMFVILSYY